MILGIPPLPKIHQDVSWNFTGKKFDSSRILIPYPITVFAQKELTVGSEWNSTAGWEQGRNTLYSTFKTKVISTNAITTNGIGNCMELEYSAPDLIDTMFFKPGKGPVEIRSWRTHLYENLQQGYGGFR